jgi:hypothetical protein
MRATEKASCCISLLLLTACAGQPVQTPVPASLVPAGEREVGRFVGRNMQTYECRAKPGDASSAVWIYVASEGGLFDAQGREVGKHTFPPPVWIASDGSKIAGSIRARLDAPRAGSAQWLLLSTQSTGGEGRFSKITSMQRLNTSGGMPPAGRCETSTIGARERVPLTADYVLFEK